MYTLNLEDKIMDLDDFKKIKRINHGATAETFQYQNIKDNKMYCVKVFTNSTDAVIKSFLREVSLLTEANNPAVLSLHGYHFSSKYENSRIIITKFYPKTLGYHILNDLEISSSKKYLIILGIAEGMKYLHSIGIIHRDLKPDNILLDENDHPVIGDLGQSRFEVQKMTTGFGTPIYMAPEYSESLQYTNKVDVYSFGIVLYEICTWGPAYKEKDSFQIMQKVAQNGHRPEIGKITDSTISGFIERCWSQDPDDRPTFQEILDYIKTKEFRDAMHANEKEVSSYLSKFGDSLDTKPKDPAEVKKLADSGDIERAVEYADMLRTGEFVKKIDIDGSIEYYTIAANANNAYAMHQCAILLVKRDKIEATRWMKSAIQQGDYDALQDLIKGGGFDKISQDELLSFTKTCADKGSADAMLSYANMIYERDKKGALSYYEKAAKAGSACAINKAAQMLQEGDGVDADPAKAAGYWQEGIKLNDSNAMFFYAISMLNDGYSDVNKKEIIGLLDRASDFGHVNAMLFKGVIYQRGYLDVQVDDTIANDYFRKAEEANSDEAAKLSFNLATQISNGKMKYFQADDAKMFLKTASQKKNVQAMIKYAEFLSKDEALACLLGASKLGSEEAREKYCNLAGHFYKLFYNTEETRLKNKADPFQHAVRIILCACSNENKAKLLEAMEDSFVDNVDDVIKEIKAAYQFMYVKEPRDDEHFKKLNSNFLKQAISETLKDSDFQD